MCGIVGLYTKKPELQSSLGSLLSAMLAQMADRGPDSAGVAIYRDPVDEESIKVTLQGDQETDWLVIEKKITEGLDATAKISLIASHAVVSLSVDGDTATEWIDRNLDTIRMTSNGRFIEIFKEKGHPNKVIDSFSLQNMAGTHALGHTRMATESRVTTEHSHPFSTGMDLCLVHNGSLSNHNQLREKLSAEGIRFQTDNDSEVAAGYLTWRLKQGASLKEALEAALVDLDGFYTFAIGTKNGFAVLRDPIACKPAVLAETDDWVAMSSEYRSIAQLPGNKKAKVWEPNPATIYSWERES
ncbi:MAG: amidophosphoribosyltransferase [Gammaproteobacteria bacterium]|nr:amidophosphoribosyltransferase [Gammaproteobacteria bacterium]MCY4218457.1 amidophosphoribosyltransferase [Gammaproteobacteria bacterium]